MNCGAHKRAFSRPRSRYTCLPSPIGRLPLCTRAADTSEHERVLAAPLRFGCPTTRIVFDLRDLDRATPPPDRQLLATLEPDETAFVDIVRATIDSLVTTQDCSIAAVAKALAVSERTLRRRLSEAETTFSSLVDRSRCELAKRELADPARSVYEVALLLGFSDQRAFARAFKRWTGQVPAEFRAQRIG